MSWASRLKRVFGVEIARAFEIPIRFPESGAGDGPRIRLRFVRIYIWIAEKLLQDQIVAGKMKLRITSITTSEVGEQINSGTTALEDQLRPLVESRQYGGAVQQFAVFFVSVDSDRQTNERICRANNRAGRYKDILTGQMVRFVGLAVPVEPSIVLRSSPGSLPAILQGLFLDALAAPAYALPQKFDRQGLLADLRAALLPLP